MKNNKRTGNLFKRIAALLLILAMTAAFALVSGCGSGSETAADGNAAAEFTLPDVEAPAASLAEATVYDVSDATGFVFSDSEITVTDGAYDGYKVEGTSLSITAAGTYVVSGSCSNGTIVVKKNVTGVTLVLNGLDLSASATAPVTCNKGSEAHIIAAEGTVNNLADDEFNNDDVYTDETLYPDIENAVIKCKDGSNVTICGAGTINVTANGKNGVKGGYDLYEEDENGNATDKLLSEASLTVKEVTLNITAMAGDGLKSDKLLNILSGNITVAAASDGVKSDYAMNIGTKGVDGPTVTVTKAEEGVEAATINVWSGSVNVSASEDGINAANSDLENYAYSYNQFGGSVVVDVTGGDGIDSNGTTYLLGGTLEVYAPSQGDGDPLDSDSGTYFGGATVLAVGHTGMAQRYNAATPYAEFSGNGLVSAGGEIRITAADGSVLYTAKAVRDASSVLFSSPDLTSGETYTLNGGTTAAAGYSGGGNRGFGGGQRPDGNKGERPDGGQTSDGEKREHPDGGRRPDGSGTDFRGSGETPPELPDGETPPTPPDGETPPTPPDGEAMPDFPDEGTHA